MVPGICEGHKGDKNRFNGDEKDDLSRHASAVPEKAKDKGNEGGLSEADRRERQAHPNSLARLVGG